MREQSHCIEFTAHTVSGTFFIELRFLFWRGLHKPSVAFEIMRQVGGAITERLQLLCNVLFIANVAMKLTTKNRQ